MLGRLRITPGPPATMWGYSSTSELFTLPEWWEQHTTSGQGSFRERSPVGSRFPESLFLDVPGSLYLWVQKRFVKFRQSTQNTRLRPCEFFWEFFSYFPFDLFRDLWDEFLSHFWIKSVLRLTVPGILRCSSRHCCFFSLIPQSCLDTEGKAMSTVKTELKFLFV